MHVYSDESFLRLQMIVWAIIGDSISKQLQIVPIPSIISQEDGRICLQSAAK